MVTTGVGFCAAATLLLASARGALPLASTATTSLDDTAALVPSDLPSDDLPSPKALEFIHIPKTGGSSIEAFGREHGYVWGLQKDTGSWHPDIYHPEVAERLPLCSEAHIPRALWRAAGADPLNFGYALRQAMASIVGGGGRTGGASVRNWAKLLAVLAAGGALVRSEDLLVRIMRRL